MNPAKFLTPCSVYEAFQVHTRLVNLIVTATVYGKPGAKKTARQKPRGFLILVAESTNYLT